MRQLVRGTHGVWLDGSRTLLDEVVVQRALAGDLSTRLSLAERREAIRRLSAEGWSGPRIAAHLEISLRSVDRHKAALRQQTAA